jgi:hypothetical protein
MPALPAHPIPTTKARPIQSTRWLTAAALSVITTILGASGPFGLTNVGKRATPRRRNVRQVGGGPFIRACCRTCGETYYRCINVTDASVDGELCAAPLPGLVRTVVEGRKPLPGLLFRPRHTPCGTPTSLPSEHTSCRRSPVDRLVAVERTDRRQAVASDAGLPKTATAATRRRRRAASARRNRRMPDWTR